MSSGTLLYKFPMARQVSIPLLQQPVTHIKQFYQNNFIWFYSSNLMNRFEYIHITITKSQSKFPVPTNPTQYQLPKWVSIVNLFFFI